jgi:hypothetical protein
MVAPSLPAFAAALPDSTGIFTFSKNRMPYLLTIWFRGFTQRHPTQSSGGVSSDRPEAISYFEKTNISFLSQLQKL